MLLIARTDAESAKLLDSNVDVADHDFILGTTQPGKHLAQTISEAEARGASSSEINQIEQDWTNAHTLCTFHDGMFQYRS
jgi:isocitrate lyase